MKKILLLLFFSVFTVAFGQTRINNNESLSLVQDIYQNTTKKNLESFMSIRGRKVEEFIKGDDYFGDTYIYDKDYYGKIQVELDLENKIATVILFYKGAYNNRIIEMRLREGRYTYKIHNYEN